MSTTTPDVVIVGAGLAGLCCALQLHEQGLSVQVLEASDQPGGRVRTDEIDGFLLDRGFQIMLTAYPEARQILNYDALDLHLFSPGALVRFNGAFHRVADPWRNPTEGLKTLATPIGSLGDKARIASLRRRVTNGSLDDLLEHPETTTLNYLRRTGFSPSMIDRFFRPFFGGVFLESDLRTSSRMFEFVFRMLSTGDNTIPARGMQRIPTQLAGRLPEGTIRTGSRVASVETGRVVLESGEEIRAGSVAVATDGAEAARLLQGVEAPSWHSAVNLYFASDRPPLTEPVLVLNGEGDGPVNNMHVASAVSPLYAPSGKSLISTTVLGNPEMDDAQLEASVREQMTGWFGESVRDWHHLRTYRIEHALPDQSPPALDTPAKPVRHGDGLYVCGDHRQTASINGAMASGRRAAQAIIEDRNG